MLFQNLYKHKTQILSIAFTKIRYFGYKKGYFMKKMKIFFEKWCKNFYLGVIQDQKAKT